MQIELSDTFKSIAAGTKLFKDPTDIPMKTPLAGSLLNKIRDKMMDNVKLKLLQNTICDIETKLRRQNECFTGFRDKDLEDAEGGHAD